MRSMGATKKVIRNQFLMEAWLLVTIAFAVSLPLTMHRIYVSGFANPSENGNPVYWQNQPLTHFLIVRVRLYRIAYYCIAGYVCTRHPRGKDIAC